MRDAAKWADQERILPPESPEPGKWRSSRIPYFNAVCAAFSDIHSRMIVVVCGSQMGKTEVELNVIGHRFDDGPLTPALFIGPTEKNVRSISKDRFSKMIHHCKSLRGKIEKGQRNTILEKYFSGVRLGFGWASSASELASHPAGLVLIDEIDRMSSNVQGEGDPVMLAQARTKNFSDSKIGIVSTPTVEGHSAVVKYWETGTKGRWAWPCPDCSEFFIPDFSLIQWPEGSTPEQALYDARLVCPNCGSLIESKHKDSMNAKGRYHYHQQKEGGEFEDIGPIPPRNPTASYWISGLCSPWQSFGEIANIMLTAYRTRDQGTIQAAINTYCGETYKLKGDAPEWQIVKGLVQNYPGDSAPDGVQVITSGVDVQKNGLYFTVRGWGFNGETWKLGSGFIAGETENDAVWLLLGRLLDKTFGGWPIDCMFVDSGYRPGDKWRKPDNMVYKFCRQHQGRVFPCKGRDTMDKQISASKIDVTFGGKLFKGGLTLWHVNTDYFKSWIHSMIRWPEDQEGGFHLNMETDDDYCKQIVNEELLITAAGRRVWNETGPNHYLDCEVYAAAAGARLQVHSLKPLEQPVVSAKPAQVEKSQPFIPKRSGGFAR